MNNAKMWLVVQPTVGVPLFLAGLAVASFAVHVAVLSNTTWVADFLSGNEMGSTASAMLPAQTEHAAYTY
jgi:light-harvesting protein B-800-850 alpha chain